DGQRPCRTLAEDPGRTQPRAAYPRRCSSNASGLHGRNSARILGIRASFQRDNLRRHFGGLCARGADERKIGQLWGGLVYALTHLFPSSEKREALLPNLDQCSRLGVTGGPSRPGLDRKGTKAPQLDAVTPGHRNRNLI